MTYPTGDTPADKTTDGSAPRLKCSICRGYGKVPRTNDPNDTLDWREVRMWYEPCARCGGTGEAPDL